MTRIPIAAANWKMHKTSAEARELAAGVRDGMPTEPTYEMVLCPPFTALTAVLETAREGSRFSVGGQNCFWEPAGAFTGEVAPPMLAELGCEYVIIGHSERRQYFGETDDTVAKRVGAALQAGLRCIVCVGESEAQRDADETSQVLERQLSGGLGALTGDDWRRIVIAYEPVWAIGTGKTATPDQANEAHAFIRNWIASHVDDTTAHATRILYGGSVKPDNAAALFQQPHIDGGLIGGASLKADQFLAITEALVSAPQAGS